MRTLQTRVSCVAIVNPRLETLRCNGVPAGCPVFSGLQTISCSLSTACRISLSAMGEALSLCWYLFTSFENYHYALRSAPTPPWGVPSWVGNNLPSITTPDFNQALICLVKVGNVLSLANSFVWLIRSKHFVISASKTYLLLYRILLKTASIAS